MWQGCEHPKKLLIHLCLSFTKFCNKFYTKKWRNLFCLCQISSYCLLLFNNAFEIDTEPVLQNFIPKWLLWNKVSSPMPVYQHQNKWSYKLENLKIKIFSPLVKTLPLCWILVGHNNFDTLLRTSKGMF